MFFLQLRQLMWKNYLVRIRSKARVIAEIIWPLAIFIILALVRLEGLKQYQKECYLKEKALPSAGPVRFYKSLICTPMNWCYNDYQNHTDFFDEILEFERARKLISRMENVLIKGSAHVEAVVNLGYSSALKRLSVWDSDGVYEEDHENEQSPNSTNSLLQNFTTDILPSPDNKKNLGSIKRDATISKIRKLNFEGGKSVESLDDLNAEFQRLDSTFSIFKEISDSEIGKFAERLWISRDKSNIDNEPNSTSVLPLLTTVCGSNPLPSSFYSSRATPRLSKKRNLHRSPSNFERSSPVKTTDTLPEICTDLFATLQNDSRTEALFEYIYPFIRGRLVYAPNTPAFTRLVEKVNTTFQDIQTIQNLANGWLEISPNITSMLNDLEETITEAIDNFENSPDIVAVLEEALIRIQSIQIIVVQLDSLAKFFSVYIECYEFDKFEGFPSEEEAVVRGLNLLNENQLWAVIIFDNADSNFTSEDELPKHLKYKIRMDKFVIDTTERIKDYVETPLPRNDPRAGHMKYFSSGFIYLQDKIEQSITALQSMSETFPGMFMQQFPSPCFVFDTFLFAIGPSFPLYMNLAFVFTCAMIIKSVVYEKERRLKETMRTMGLSNGVHWLAWFIDSLLILLFACIMLPLIIYFGNILEKSNPFVVFVFLLSFSIATICFSFLVSTFFSRANLAAASGAFIYFLCYQPVSLLDLGFETSPYAANLLLSLFSNVAFGIGNAYLIGLEESGEGAQWNNIGTSPREGDTFSLLECILMLLLDSVIYLVLTWYIETVFPGQYGIPKPWYFMFQSSYWFSGKDNANVVTFGPRSGAENSDLIEDESSRNLMVGVSIRNLGKTYSNGKVALTNLNLDFYEDQITSFLGHNGAGKTTTISILTGLFPPSSGTASINGLDIRYQIDDIRHQLGVCPQHNVLFDQLTVEEHLRFFANLKTGEQMESRKEIDKMIEDLGLSHKRHDISEHLSGGMKRKLSIGAAFIGNSKTVILDEPTAGVDPYSRRSIWDILLKYKAGRTIILTTHFMDEADLLGDRIAIISQGQLKCCGSSLFLKQKLGSGYYLTVVRKDDTSHDGPINNGQANENQVPRNAMEIDTERIVTLVKQHIPNATIVENVGSDIVFCLPEFDEAGLRQRNKFPHLFDELDLNMEQLRVDSYGVSDTTLEEIFLRVADDPSADSNFPPPSVSDLDENPYREENGGSDSFNLESNEKLKGKKLVAQQMKAMYIKRFNNSKRNVKGFFCEIVLPCILVIIGELFSLTLDLETPQPPLVLSPWLYGDVNQVFYSNRELNDNWANAYVHNMLNETGMGVRCLDGEPLLGLNCSIYNIGLLNPTANPETYQDINCPCNDFGAPICPANATQGELFHYGSVSYDEFFDLADKNISTWILRTHEEFNEIRIGGFEFGVHQNPPIQNASENNVRVWFDNKAWASSVSYLNAINNVILRSSLPPSKDPFLYGITVINHPMEFSSREVVDNEQVAVSLAYALTVLFALSFVPASFVIFLVEERTSKAKHLQFVSGVKPTTFWVASYTWDLVNYLIPCILVILIFLAFGQWEYVGATSIGGFIILLILFGVSAIPLMYPTSFVFSVPSTAFVGLACANLFIAIVTVISSYVLQLFDDEHLIAVGEILDQVFLIFPHFCFGRGLIDLAETYFTAKNFELIGVVYERNIFEWDYLGRYFVCFILQAIVFFAFNLMLHYPFFPKLIARYYQKKSLPPLGPEDADVARERARVEKSNAYMDELLLQRLTKVYNGQKNPATDRLSFGLKKGECFGLLGVNGAGKSTTFKMLTGDETVTNGNAFVGGSSILTDLSEAQQNLGYCPQEDALLPLLTGVEHLQLFARLRGVPKQYINKLVNDKLRKLSLLPYKDRCAGTYSGGNKRKLSTAIALVGNPAVVFLDEPSSGMDPRARRSLWQAVIDAVNDSRSVLLTSHSMEECQVLCTRLAIMVNGTLRCLGSAQHLKNKFGDGYMINVRCEVETISEVLQCVESLIPEARLRERRSRQLIWHVQPNLLQISTLFQRMEDARTATPMVDYSITQTTLDDVFVRFARLQREVLDDGASEEPDFDSSTLSGTHNNSISTDDDLLTSL
ncbi:hypothetical protein OUZ56_022545 [Daphnia magna]|uniref:ABC transporter domain-containing protein n=1 Tax=Daphnia magna TaxID=35525 RepID=A0ABR0AWQ7_9CRUS|nr:hypothetical protein OUZ56_022545 [Daphnia magna]